MFCPRCGTNQSDELRFCKGCGANLHAVKKLIDPKEGEKKFDWSDTWVAEMFLSGDAHERRKLEIERARGLTPEVKRYNEIKAGVITASVGLSLMIFLHIFMNGLINGGKLPEDTAEILSHVWTVGVIPLFVGIALIVNGVFVSKKIVDAAKKTSLPGREVTPPLIRSADTNEFVPNRFSVTEGTTKHLSSSSES